MGYLGAVPVLLLLAGQSLAQTTNYRVCVDVSKSLYCQAVQKDDSRVSCVIGETNVECAVKISQGQADFGVFSEEEVFLIAQQLPTSHLVVGSVRHQDKLADSYAFESVAVVRSNHTGGLPGLRDGGFCHPGYNYREHRWSPRVLKYFEDAVAQTSQDCDPGSKTPAGSQAAAVSRFFKRACRPGAWSQDPTDDALLKSRYPSLCELCNSNANCTEGYTSTVTAASTNSHQLALECLVSGSGNVSYVAWQHVRSYFLGRPDVTSYSLICEDGTLRQLTADLVLNGTAPCSWVRQPWSALLASRDQAPSLLTNLRTWMPTGRSQFNDGRWTDSLDQILFSEPSVRLVFNDTLPSPTDYVTPGRGALSALETNTGCHKVQRWCIVSAVEQFKCSWLRQAAISLGIEPRIECVVYSSEIECLNTIQMDRADFISLDSNYGYLARQHYKLSTVLYHQTQRAHSSRVVALLKTSTTDSLTGSNDTVTRFENLRGKTACFPEYGGLAWVSFVRAAHERQVISETECDYPSAVSQFFSSSCAPGAEQATHTISSEVTPASLCGACRPNANYSTATTTTTTTTPAPGTQGDANAPTVIADLTCAADYSNLYFSTNGTLACIAADHTDVAFIETQYLASTFTALNLNPANFRVLCRNNSLALYTGVDVDDACLLSYTVDGELLARRDWEQTIALKSLFLTLDDLFGYSTGVNQLINFKIYSSFNGSTDLLFKDSAIGLADSSSTSEQVRNYEELFRHLDACSAGASTTLAPPPASAARAFGPLVSLAAAALLAKIMI